MSAEDPREHTLTCPVCYYPEPLHRFDICPACGSQFGYVYDSTVDGTRLAELRARWISDGAQWWSKARHCDPAKWHATLEKHAGEKKP